MLLLIETKGRNNIMDNGRKSILLISNKIFHYRIPIYNYLNQRFGIEGYSLTVIAPKIQGLKYYKNDFNLHITNTSIYNYYKIKKYIRQNNPPLIEISDEVLVKE